MTGANGPLKNIRVVDLTRVLAGPVCTQMLGDLGADVIKIERPPEGDDTRAWGPPFLKDGEGRETDESAYYLSANRNKRSVVLDLAREQDREKLHALLRDADVLVENFKVGSLARLGFGYEQLKTRYPRLVYASITGFGQTGPWAQEPGYDFIIQGLSGFMSVTGEPSGGPVKAGVAIIDYVTGLNTVIGILAALRARDETGRGQHVDLALLDSALAMLTNIAQYALTSGQNPPRVGNAHTTIVPYNAFQAADGWVILAVGNDHQFAHFCEFAGRPELARDQRFATNEQRVIHRETLTPMIAQIIAAHPVKHWMEGLIARGVPCGPVNSMLDALHLPQLHARDMIVHMDHPAAPAPIALVGNPVKLSETPVAYRRAPPVMGADQDGVFSNGAKSETN
ncbi:MAG: CoA transferase [Rhodospirillales bacterium]|nr:CoA transferase [Alphaproteobacteria bacterium]MCB9986770.1 CoA transferase [Rhodospirillales bacterium]USO08459.1 MAG: CoA transferase [Rhodospirillales bacterium]